MRSRVPVSRVGIAARAAGVVFVIGVLAACSAQATPTTGTSTTTVGTITQLTTVTSAMTTSTVKEQPTTVVVTPTDPTLVPPPPSTPEPPPERADCPYLTTAQVKDANGQNVGAVETIATEPHPVCIFHRPDGTVMAVVRIVVAASPAEAAAAVNQHVPVADSFEVSKPSGWVGGAIGNQHGVDGYPDGQSIYAVSKDTIAVIAISNQKQSIKGRQMVTDVIDNLGL